MQEPTEPDQSKPKGKPPYFFLIPVGLGLAGFIGYQTIRIGTATEATNHYQFAIDTSTAAPVRSGTIVVHANSPARAPRRVAANARPPATPSPQPTPTPTPGPSASPAPNATPRAATPKVVLNKPVRHGAGRHPAPRTIARGPAPQDRPVAARAASLVTRENAQPQNVSEATTPPITDAPIVRKEATAQPVQVAEAQHQSAEAAPVNAADRVIDAKMTYAASPDYPEIARDQGVRGTSVVFVTVGPSGAIVHLSIASSSGNSTLDRSALTAARSSRYVAPKVDGQPATETYRVTYDFAP